MHVTRTLTGTAWNAAALMLLGAIGVGACTSAALAQSKDDAQRKLEKSRQELDERQRRERGISNDLGQLKAERERLNASLVETARLIQKGEAQMTQIESRLGDLEAQEAMLRGSLAQRHDSIAHLLAAMQRMGRNPPPVMITRREDALSMVRSAMMLAAAFPELRGQAEALVTRLNDLVRVMTDIRTEGDKLKAETARLNDSRTRLAQLMESKRQTLAERQVELDRVRREAIEISRNVTDLNELITRLDKAVAEHTGQGTQIADAAGEANPSARLEVAALPEASLGVASAPILADPGALAKAGNGAPAAVELAPSGAKVASLSPGRIKPAVPFGRAKGLVLMPAQGRRVLSFGDKTQYGGQSKGLVLETRHGAQVTSPCDGWIVFAGEFRTFGQLLIINAGDGYHILLAGLSQIDVQLGQFVLTGEPVGQMAAAPKAQKSNTQGNAPVLYIEFRKDSKPIDPEPWWAAAGSQKVQG